MNAPILRKGAHAEQVGQELAADTLAAMREPGSDSAAAFLLAEALRDLAELPRRDRACEGFAAELVRPLRLSAPEPAADNAHCSEQAGAAIALACLDALLAAKDSTQGQRIRAVQSAIVQLSATGDPGAAAAGFACIVENVISRGMGVQP